MKKLMAIFGATLMLACVATSCSKVCECTFDYGGAYTTTSEVNLKGTGYNCKTYAEYLDNASLGTYKVECKKK